MGWIRLWAGMSRTTRVSRYQKGETDLDFTEASDSEWQWHQLGQMQVCISLQIDNHASSPPLSFYRPDALPAAQTNSVKALKEQACNEYTLYKSTHSLTHPVARTVLLARNRWMLPSSSDSAITPLHWPSSIIRSVAKYSM